MELRAAFVGTRLLAAVWVMLGFNHPAALELELELAPLEPLGLGCCDGIAHSDEYYNEAGLTLEECVDLCSKQRPFCKAIEHNPWALGACHLFQAAPSGLNCPLSEKVCWSVEPPQEPLPAIFVGGPAHEALENWYTQELWDSLNCAGKGMFDEIRHHGMAATELGQVDHQSAWNAAKQRGFFGYTEPGDTTAFFASQENKEFLGNVLETTARFQNLLRGDVEYEDASKGALSGQEQCKYGLLFLLWLCLKRFRQLGNEEEARRVAWALRVTLWTQVAGPESSLDLMQSTTWPLSSWDIVVASRDGESTLAMTYEEHTKQHPTQPPSLPPPLLVLPRGRSHGSTVAGQLWPCGPERTARVATLGIMRQMQMHQLSALQVAWEAVCGADLGAPHLEVLFVYTEAGPMSEYDVGSLKDRGTDWEARAQTWQGMTVRFLPGGMQRICKLNSLNEVQADFEAKFREEEGLKNADLLLCGEPVYVCTAAARVLEAADDGRPLLAHLGMALLHQPQTDLGVLDSRTKAARFFVHFLAMLARPATFVSVANRITLEQLFWQLGVRFPVAHFAGIHLVPQAEREEEPKALLFRTKFPYLAHVFTRALKLFARQSSKVELVDMNHFASLSWAEIAFFRAVVLLPHNVHLIRTADLYALELMLFVPSAPFIFQFIFPGSNLYGGHGADPVLHLGLDRAAQQQLHRALRLAENGYFLGTARTAAKPGELLPRREYLYCPYRFPSLGSCHMKRVNAQTLVQPCPWGAYDLDSEKQTALSCEEVVGAEPSWRSLSSSLCGADIEVKAVEGGADPPEVGNRTALEPAAELHAEDGPAVDPFDHLYGDYNPWCGLDAYRFWYLHTDYALLRGLQRFGSVAELLAGLEDLLLAPGAPERRRAVLEEMRAHQRARVHETVQWWGHAVLQSARLMPQLREK